MELDPEEAGLLSLSHDNGKQGQFDEDQDVQDWSMINRLTKGNQKNVPKRGEKDFAPIVTGDSTNNGKVSNYDIEALSNSRNAMFEALAKKRGIITSLNKLPSSTIYIDLDQKNTCFMFHPSGKFLHNMGKIGKDGICSFEFEEALYLVERGTCVCKIYKEHMGEGYSNKLPPVSLESLYAMLMKNPEDVNEYLVYSILKRNGYTVTRHSRVFESLLKETSTPNNATPVSRISLWSRVWNFTSSILSKIFGKFYSSYSSMLQSIRSLLLPKSLLKKQNSNTISHSIIFDVWKPSSSYKKKTPPIPDYQIVVVNAFQGFPNFETLNTLFTKSCLSNTTLSNPKKMAGVSEKLQVNDRRITFAVVDDGLVNFVTLRSCDFEKAGSVWKDDWFTGNSSSFGSSFKKHRGRKYQTS